MWARFLQVPHISHKRNVMVTNCLTANIYSTNRKKRRNGECTELSSHWWANKFLTIRFLSLSCVNQVVTRVHTYGCTWKFFWMFATIIMILELRDGNVKICILDCTSWGRVSRHLPPSFAVDKQPCRICGRGVLLCVSMQSAHKTLGATPTFVSHIHFYMLMHESKAQDWRVWFVKSLGDNLKH